MCMYVSIYPYIYISVYVYMYIYVYGYMYTFIYLHKDTYICLSIYIIVGSQDCVVVDLGYEEGGGV